MNRDIISKIQAEMAKDSAPGMCRCCPITIYKHLFPKKLKDIGCTKKWISLCKELGIKYSGGMDCLFFFKAFMDISVNRFCRI